MIATARVRLDTTTLEARDKAGAGDAEVVDVAGADSPDWDAAKAAALAVVPAGAQIISWMRTV